MEFVCIILYPLGFRESLVDEERESSVESQNNCLGI